MCKYFRHVKETTLCDGRGKLTKDALHSLHSYKEITDENIGKYIRMNCKKKYKAIEVYINITLFTG